MVYRSDKLHLHDKLAAIETFDCIADLANEYHFETLRKFGVGNWDEGSIVCLDSNNLISKTENIDAQKEVQAW